jgi:tetratricopeptide (TPR) repeat protein
VAGIDEASARSVLAVMQDRLARDPMSALGISAGSTVEELRSAFLQLTKQYHPVRFGRMALDIQKASNEVFLALRAAHDALAKTMRRRSGPMAAVRPPSAPATSPIPVTSGGRTQQPSPPHPVPRVPQASGTGERPSVAAPVAAPAPQKIAARPTTNAPTTRPIGTVRPVSPPQLVTARDESVVVELLSRQQWDQARTALHQLAARDPSSKRIRALACYARGREAQLDGRVDDARVELHDALDLDPELSLAKTALTELFTRRK